MKILLSIKPEFAYKIISGEKIFEYRKTLFKNKDVSSIIIYATKPLGKVIGEFEIDQILSNTPKQIWDDTQKFSGITKDFFNKYFSNKEIAFAIKIKNVKEYEVPLELKTFNPAIKVAPQSFCYINN